MLDLLWEIAQHKYGWTYVRRRKLAAKALERRGLVDGRWSPFVSEPLVIATGAGRDAIARRWPVSPADDARRFRE
jgi:hypothetical protein